MSQPANGVATPSEAADATTVDPGAAASAIALSFKSKITAPISPERKAELDAVLENMRSGTPSPDAPGAAASPNAAPTNPPPAPAGSPPPGAGVVVPKGPAGAPVAPVATPAAEPVSDPRIIETAKAQSRKEFQLKQREAAIAPLEKKYATMAAADAALRGEDPEAFFEAVGVPFAEVVRRVAAKRAGKPMPSTPVDTAVKALEARVAAAEEQTRKANEDFANREHQVKVDAYKATVQQAVAAKPDAFVFVLAEGPTAIDAIFRLQDLHYTENGETLPIEEAAAQVEAALEKRYAPIASALQKKNGHAAPAAPAAPAAATVKVPSAPVTGQAKSPTLTSQHVPTTASAQPAEPPENETEEERFERIARKHIPAMYPGQRR